MAAGTVHGVGEYAPAGYRLERTDYCDGGALHRFTCEGKPELVCGVGAHQDERAALEAFKAHFDAEAAPKPVEVAETVPAPAPKASKSKWRL